jgi:hypothetical protein
MRKKWLFAILSGYVSTEVGAATPTPPCRIDSAAPDGAPPRRLSYQKDTGNETTIIWDQRSRVKYSVRP